MPIPSMTPISGAPNRTSVPDVAAGDHSVVDSAKREVIAYHKRCILAATAAPVFYRELAEFRKVFLQHGLAEISEAHKNFFDVWLNDPMIQMGFTPGNAWPKERS